MKLSSPEPLPEGFKVKISEPVETPELTYDISGWQVNSEWMRVTDTIRAKVLSVLYDSRGNLFKVPPTQKILENLFTPWVVINTSGLLQFKCELPLVPTQNSGKGVLELTGISIKKSGIMPIWNLKSHIENTPVVDFNWEEADAIDTDLREVTLIESEVAGESTGDTLQLQTDDEYNVRKFAAKERVKEARLKAILARRAAEVETQRYFNEFNINDAESTFSEYDISDFSEEEEEEEEDQK
jgi:hypothetical protein